ncbi:hypothetical protein [Hymenobacter sp. GOD-10R]|uniref:hypothetical protein n=1 Tax=Hymenobacter sp. GOD-10R TaxID=3093922 RepID=UPI002D798E83|nr:hypothetical protein [Hymenobacter sp. GOD-10R]WRQ26659.1 hypothetical protein SD425_16425 [Hymenobacter sp. GOD-10R]
MKGPRLIVPVLIILAILIAAWQLHLPEGWPRVIVALLCLLVFLVFGFLGWRANKKQAKVIPLKPDTDPWIAPRTARAIVKQAEKDTDA